jgi:hypothetical protein
MRFHNGASLYMAQLVYYISMNEFCLASAEFHPNFRVCDSNHYFIGAAAFSLQISAQFSDSKLTIVKLP